MAAHASPKPPLDVPALAWSAMHGLLDADSQRACCAASRGWLARFWRGCGVVVVDDVDVDVDALDALRQSLVAETASTLMTATRSYFTDERLADSLGKVFEPLLPGDGAREVGVCAEMRFIAYAGGGMIGRHSDGARYCPVKQRSSDTSFLLYMTDVAEGGTTDFVADDDSVLLSVEPRRRRLLLFPHNIVHRGSVVFPGWPKVALRGDFWSAPRPKKAAPDTTAVSARAAAPEREELCPSDCPCRSMPPRLARLAHLTAPKEQ